MYHKYYNYNNNYHTHHCSAGSVNVVCIITRRANEVYLNFEFRESPGVFVFEISNPSNEI